MNTIKLLVILVAGLCLSSAEKSIQTSGTYAKCKIYVPNAFSPNNDGINDEFLPLPGSDCTISDYEIKIFDRNGSLVFQTNSSTEGWNGKHRGELAPATVYYYIFRYTLMAEFGEEKEIETGDLSLLR